MSSAQADDLFQRWCSLREQGRLVLPEWLCGDDVALKQELARRIDALQAAERPRPLRSAAPFATASADEELAQLLRKRLRWLGIIFQFWWIAWGVIYLLSIQDAPYEVLDGWVHIINCLVLAALTALLWSKQPLSMKQLRSCELAMFALLVIDIGWDHYRYLHAGWMDGVARPGQESKLMDLYGDSMAMPWVLIMLVYAMYIPNTLRRGAIMIAMMG
ncbi:MAG: hypothetical protein AB7K24_09665, partial [Gemmataceae bacterium]